MEQVRWFHSIYCTTYETQWAGVVLFFQNSPKVSKSHNHRTLVHYPLMLLRCWKRRSKCDIVDWKLEGLQAHQSSNKIGNWACLPTAYTPCCWFVSSNGSAVLLPRNYQCVAGLGSLSCWRPFSYFFLQQFDSRCSGLLWLFFLFSCTEGSLVAFVVFATVSAELVAFEKDILRNVLAELGVPTPLAADILTYETESCYWRPGCCMLL